MNTQSDVLGKKCPCCGRPAYWSEVKNTAFYAFLAAFGALFWLGCLMAMVWLIQTGMRWMEGVFQPFTSRSSPGRLPPDLEAYRKARWRGGWRAFFFAVDGG